MISQSIPIQNQSVSEGQLVLDKKNGRSMPRGAASTPSAANTLIDSSLMRTEQSRHSDMGHRTFKLGLSSPYFKKVRRAVSNFIEIREHSTISAFKNQSTKTIPHFLALINLQDSLSVARTSATNASERGRTRHLNGLG